MNCECKSFKLQLVCWRAVQFAVQLLTCCAIIGMLYWWINSVRVSFKWNTIIDEFLTLVLVRTVHGSSMCFCSRMKANVITVCYLNILTFPLQRNNKIKKLHKNKMRAVKLLTVWPIKVERNNVSTFS